MILYILFFLVCLISYLLHTFWHYQVCKGVDFQIRSKLFNVWTHVVVFAGYFAFGFMIFTDPLTVSISIILRIIGLTIGLSGFVIMIIAVFQKKGYTETDQLIVTGIYSRLRNPMYLGIIFIHTGLPLFFGSMITLISALLWIPQIFLWKYWEEKHLGKKFGEQYVDYKKRTWF